MGLSSSSMIPRDSSYSYGSSNDLEESFLLRHSPWHARMLKGASASTASIIASYRWILSGYYAGVRHLAGTCRSHILDSFALLFQGILRLGTLVHSCKGLSWIFIPFWR